jgi:hypothetical protein
MGDFMIFTRQVLPSNGENKVEINLYSYYSITDAQTYLES